MRVVDVLLAFPGLVLALALVAFLGPSLRNLILVIGIVAIPAFARIARASTLRVSQAEFVLAARILGERPLRILRREVLPNIANHLVVVATLEVALAILLEAVLSFLGLGVPPPLPSWGLMIAEGKDYMFFEPWVIMVPGIALFTLVLGINLLGDGLRDLLGASRDG